MENQELPTLEFLRNDIETRHKILTTKGFTEEQANLVMDARIIKTREFAMANFDMLETQDKELLEKHTKRLAKYSIMTLIPTIVLSGGLTSLTRGRIFDLPMPVRATIRLSIFALPIGGIIYSAMGLFDRCTLFLEHKYADRIMNYSRSGDPRDINPELPLEKSQ